MLAKDWFNFVSAALLSNRGDGQSNSGSGQVANQGGSAMEVCNCVIQTADNKTIDKSEDNLIALALFANNSATTIDKLSKLPSLTSITLDQTIFTLYTRTGPTNGTRIAPDNEESLRQSGYVTTKPTVIATHGYISSTQMEWMNQLKTAQLLDVDCNFITIDWSACSRTCCYYGAIQCEQAVGGYLRQLLISLRKMGCILTQFHLMGHSLGAHLVSQATRGGLLVGRITGMDPPLLGFSLEDREHRIDPNDAILVDIIHSSSSTQLGWNHVLGKWDFFPNSAGTQPGCPDFNPVCSHSMSHDFYIDSLYRKKKYRANKCENVGKALEGDCHGPIGFMGVLAPEALPGVYYLKVEEPANNEP